MSLLELIRHRSIMWNVLYIQETSWKKVKIAALLHLLERKLLIMMTKYQSSWVPGEKQFSSCCRFSGLLKLHVIPPWTLISREAAAQRTRLQIQLQSHSHDFLYIRGKKKCRPWIINPRRDLWNYHRASKSSNANSQLLSMSVYPRGKRGFNRHL